MNGMECSIQWSNLYCMQTIYSRIMQIGKHKHSLSATDSFTPWLLLLSSLCHTCHPLFSTKFYGRSKFESVNVRCEAAKNTKQITFHSANKEKRLDQRKNMCVCNIEEQSHREQERKKSRPGWTPPTLVPYSRLRVNTDVYCINMLKCRLL